MISVVRLYAAIALMLAGAAGAQPEPQRTPATAAAQPDADRRRTARRRDRRA